MMQHKKIVFIWNTPTKRFFFQTEIWT